MRCRTATHKHKHKDLIYVVAPAFDKWYAELRTNLQSEQRKGVVTPEMLADQPEQFKPMVEKTRNLLQSQYRHGKKIGGRRDGQAGQQEGEVSP